MSNRRYFNHLPDWVQFIAQDGDGQWWGYEAEPNQSHNGWYENEVGRVIRLESDAPNPDWRNALLQVKESP